MEVRHSPSAGAWPHVAVPVVDASQVGAARREAAGLAAGCELDVVAAGRLAIVVSELASNLLKHARDGRLLLRGRRQDDAGGPAGVEVLSVDAGPGMRDVGESLRDGYSTTGTSGNGLGAVRRQADAFDVWSEPGRGTVIHARVDREPATAVPVRPALPARLGVVATAAPGETACGDAWAWHEDGELAALLVADGLGHGPEAAQAARAALDVFHEAPFDDPERAVARMHERLRGLRGAAATMCRLDGAAQRMRFAGAGNVTGRVIAGDEERALLAQHGTLGVAMRRVHAVEHAWPPHAWLVLHTDGIASRWSLPATLRRHPPALSAAWLWREHGRGRDDATIAIARRGA